MHSSAHFIAVTLAVGLVVAGRYVPVSTPDSRDATGSVAAGAGDVVYLAPAATGQVVHENRLMVVPATGGTSRELFSPRCLGIVPGCEYGDPAWSHDGQRLAFAFRGVSQETIGTFQIRIARGDGKVHWVVTEHAGPNTKPTWSADKRMMAYQHQTIESGRYRFWIATANLCGRLPVKTPTKITEGAHPSFSQSGDWIAYSFNGDIYKIRPDGSQRIRLTSGSAQDLEPAWTKPGTTQGADQIAFASNRSGSNGYDIYLMNADGSNIRRLTKLSGDERRPDLPETPLFVTHETGSGPSRTIRSSTVTSSKSIASPGWSPALGTSGKVSGGCPPT